MLSRILLLVVGYLPAHSLRTRMVMKSGFMQSDFTKNSLRFIEESARAERVDPVEEMRHLKKLDISRANPYYESLLPFMETMRNDTKMGIEKKAQLEESYSDLMHMGYDRRLGRQETGNFLLQTSARRTAFHMELGKSKVEQLKELKKVRLEQRSGLVKLLPESMHKYFDYMNSLQIQPKGSDLRSNLMLGAFFAIVVVANRILRSCFMFANVAQLMLISTLLTRNIPEQPTLPGMGRRRVATWSGSAFRTAVGITLYYFWCTAGMVGAALAIFPISLYAKAKAALTAGVLSASYFTSFYEVYEEKTKAGWRWKQALEGTSLTDVDDLIERNSNEKKIADIYDFPYDPMVSEFPPQQIYVDEIPGVPAPPTAAGDMDENEWKTHYAEWKESRKDARRAPVTDVAPETPWVGGKVGTFVNKAPKWINSAYKKSVQNMNKWRGQKPKHKRDTSEFEPIEGPLGFRDKRPDWLEIFGSGVWEETGSAGKKAARAFGTYRKCMWKLDKNVVLQKCDE